MQDDAPSLPLGQHAGLPSPDPELLARAALRACGRGRIGADVPARRRLIDRALLHLDTAGTAWMERFAADLAADGSLDGAQAVAVSMAAAWDTCPAALARILARANLATQPGAAADDHAFTEHALRSLMAGAREFATRFRAGRINSDEVFLRVALMHAFRRPPDDLGQAFIMDGAARILPRVLGLNTGTFTARVLEHGAATAPPETAWGYLVVLKDQTSKSGLYLMPPTAEAQATITRVAQTLEAALGPLEPEALAHHAAAAFFSGHYAQGDLAGFAALMAALLERVGLRYAVLYAREDPGGVHSALEEIPADSVADARTRARKMPMVGLHDQTRDMTETLRQIQDAASRTPHS